MPASTTVRLRTWQPLLWLFPLVVATLLFPNPLWTTLLLGVGGMVLLSYAWARSMARHLRGTRRLRFGWVAVGDRLVEQFEVVCDSRFPTLWVELVDHSTVPGYAVSVVRSVYNGVERWDTAAICLQRGQFFLGPWTLRTTDPFGLLEVRIEYPVSDEVIIHPPVDTALPLPLPAGQSSGRSRAREAALQATINAASVRDYRPGDPLRWIHWRASARHGTLHVREFDLDAAGALWIVVDLAANVQLGDGPENTEEYGVLLAAAVAARALRVNRPVGLALYGKTLQILPPSVGMAQQWAILRALALARADGTTGLGRGLADLRRQAQRGSAALIITARGDADWRPELAQLLQRAIPCQVVLLDRQSFGDSAGVAPLRDLLLATGCAVHVVRQGELRLEIDPAERQGFWEFRTTATGRVIVVNDPTRGDEAKR